MVHQSLLSINPLVVEICREVMAESFFFKPPQFYLKEREITSVKL